MYDSEAPYCYCEYRPTARKRHKCCECRGWIEPGEKYQKVTGIWDARPSTFKTCSDCEALRKEADEGAAYDELQCFGMLYEWASENPGPRAKYISIMEKRGATIHPSWKD